MAAALTDEGLVSLICQELPRINKAGRPSGGGGGERHRVCAVHVPGKANGSRTLEKVLGLAPGEGNAD